MTGPGFDYETFLAQIVAAITAIDCTAFRFIGPPNEEKFRESLVIDQEEQIDHWAHLDFRVDIGALSLDSGGDIGTHQARVLYTASNPFDQPTAGNIAAIRAGLAILQVLANLPIDPCLVPGGLSLRPIPGVEWYRCEAAFFFTVPVR